MRAEAGLKPEASPVFIRSQPSAFSLKPPASNLQRPSPLQPFASHEWMDKVLTA